MIWCVCDEMCVMDDKVCDIWGVCVYTQYNMYTQRYSLFLGHSLTTQ